MDTNYQVISRSLSGWMAGNRLFHSPTCAAWGSVAIASKTGTVKQSRFGMVLLRQNELGHHMSSICISQALHWIIVESSSRETPDSTTRLMSHPWQRLPDGAVQHSKAAPPPPPPPSKSQYIVMWVWHSGMRGKRCIASPRDHDGGES